MAKLIVGQRSAFGVRVEEWAVFAVVKATRDDVMAQRAFRSESGGIKTHKQVSPWFPTQSEASHALVKAQAAQRDKAKDDVMISPGDGPPPMSRSMKKRLAFAKKEK